MPAAKAAASLPKACDAGAAGSPTEARAAASPVPALPSIALASVATLRSTPRAPESARAVALLLMPPVTLAVACPAPSRPAPEPLPPFAVAVALAVPAEGAVGHTFAIQSPSLSVLRYFLTHNQ